MKVIAHASMSAEEFDALLENFDAEAEDLARAPDQEPWRSEWCRLHALHELALTRLDLPENREACRMLVKKKAVVVADFRAATRGQS